MEWMPLASENLEYIELLVQRCLCILQLAILEEGRSVPSVPKGLTPASLRNDIADLTAKMRQWESLARQGKFTLPIQQVSEGNRLTALQVELLSLALALEVDSQVREAARILQSTMHHPSLTAAFVLQLFCERRAERLEHLSELICGSPVMRLGLLKAEAGGSLLESPMSMPEWVVRFLLGEELPAEIVPEHPRLARRVHPVHDLDELVLTDALRSRLLALVPALQQKDRDALLLSGIEGTGKRSICRALALRCGRDLIELDLGAILPSVPLWSLLLEQLVQESRITGALLVFHQADRLLEVSSGEADPAARVLRLVLESLDLPLLMTANTSELQLTELKGRYQLIEVPLPAAREMGELWTRRLCESGGTPPSSDELHNLSIAHPCSPGVAGQAARRAVARARLRLGVSAGEVSVELAELVEALNENARGAMSDLAVPMAGKMRLVDLAFPKEIEQALRELCNQVLHRERVWDDWQFSRAITRSRGISCLFDGPPGTGKTQTALALANELARPLFRVDLSQVMSKWVGETEKNLSLIFRRAASYNAMLLFDEADSLFAQRTQVTSVQDRYGNLSVNMLLQLLESFEGIAVLTTNRPKDIDEAFKRRLTFRITLPLPDMAEREKIWRNHFPKEAPLADRIRWRSLADEFEMSGGHIRNAILRAAFAAANEGSVIKERHLREAAWFEYQETGRLVRSCD